LFGDEVKGAFDAIRIGQLERSPSGAVQLRPNCVPPCLRIGASPWLIQQFRGLLGIMTGRQRTLSQARRQRTGGAIEFDAADAMRFWFLDVLNSSIPVFSHLVDSAAAHPERAYLVLAGLLGRLCSFADADPSAVPRFDYLDLGSVFDPMFRQAAQLLSSVISDRYAEIPLSRRDDGVYVGHSAGPEIMRSTFFLAVSGALPEDQLRDRLPKLMKVASVNQIGAILKSAMNGAALELEYRPPAALPVRPGVTFFRIARTPDFWANIAATGTFALYHPFEPQSLDLALYAVDSTSA
jgi:type VI secretion system protein ImpJ